jgi:ferredoxin
MGIEHIASTGLDLWLGSLAYGFGEVVLLLSGDEDPAYRAALEEQADLANAMLAAYQFPGARVQLIAMTNKDDLLGVSSAMGRLRQRGALQSLGKSAVFAFSNQKRETVEATLEHFQKLAPVPLPAEGKSLPSSSLLGAIQINTAACTLCMSCVGACPEGAILDNPDAPQLSFIEKQCVQCGLCVQTCPESAITLLPRIATVEQRKEKVLLNETKPFHCISCGKAFGTLKLVELMLGKLALHDAFSGEALDRLKMCSDCRVVDMMKKEL